MPRPLRFIVILVGGFALLGLATATLVQQTTRRWSEHDLLLRARLAVAGGRTELLDAWNDPIALAVRLNDLVRDDRIMAAGACGPSGVPRAATPGFSPDLPCPVLTDSTAESGKMDPRFTVRALPGGLAHVTTVPLMGVVGALGSVIVVHDFSFVVQREASTRRFIMAGFGLMALAAPGVFWIAVRLSRRGWSDEIRRALRGKQPPRREFLPILGDVRELVAQLAADDERDPSGGAWSPARLRQTLTRHLHGERVVILANREPYIHHREGRTVTVRHPASGLVSALEPVMRTCSGTWVAHGSGSADREFTDTHDRVRVPPGEESYDLRRVWLTAEEERGYYYGLANEGLWPLCHLAHERPVFRIGDWRHYQAVNRKFVDALCDEVDSDDPIVLVQDYHFALAPRLIRERLPRATIIMFWHIPWPNAERFGICPWRDALLDGMLGASIVGFQTQAHCNNFVDAADRYLECRIDREAGAVVRAGRRTLIRPYPISVEWPSRSAGQLPSPAECRRAVLAEHELPPNALLGVGVDRLDYTKGIEERLLAVEKLLERFPEFVGRFVFLQLAAPSRTEIHSYRTLGNAVETLVTLINQRFGRAGYRPIVLLRNHHEPVDVFRYYRAADLCYVSSLADGMNLVAKEFVSARDDEQGVLVLSQFTGAARELTEALIVNPYDLEQSSAALAAALTMPPDEQRDRMAAMRALLAHFNVYRWAGRMLLDAARLRSRDRLAGRLTGSGDLVALA